MVSFDMQMNDYTSDRWCDCFKAGTFALELPKSNENVFERKRRMFVLKI